MSLQIRPHAYSRFIKRGGVDGTLPQELEGRELVREFVLSGKQFCFLPCGMMAVIIDDAVITVLSRRQAVKQASKLKTRPEKPKRRPKEFRHIEE